MPRATPSSRCRSRNDRRRSTGRQGYIHGVRGASRQGRGGRPVGRCGLFRGLRGGALGLRSVVGSVPVRAGRAERLARLPGPALEPAAGCPEERRARARATTIPGSRGGRRGSPAAPHRAGPARRSAGPDGRCRHETGPRSRPSQHLGCQARGRRPRPGPGAGRRRPPRSAGGDHGTATSSSIHPPALAEGLGAALASLAARSDLPVELVIDLPQRPSHAIETIAYFCAAELLTNAAKHSGAPHAKLEAHHQRGLVTMRISDDGTGGARLEPGGGLAGLAERVKTVDGRLQVESPAGGPTVVTVQLPSHV